MKITDVKAWVVEPQGPMWGSTMDRHWTFVRIDTDEGISGWGEATNSPRNGSFLTAQAVLAMKEALVGEDPVNIEPLWHKLYRRYTYMGSRGLPTIGDQRDRYCALGHQGQGVGQADLRSAGREFQGRGAVVCEWLFRWLLDAGGVWRGCEEGQGVGA